MEIAQNYKSDLRFEPDAMLALQAASEDYLVNLFHDMGTASIRSDRECVVSSVLITAPSAA
jgi:histone H3